MADPFSDVQNCIWTVLNASDEFTALVPATMQQDLDGDGRKIAAMHGTPKYIRAAQVRVEPVGGTHDPQIDSHNTVVTQGWLIQILHKDERPTEELLPVKWAILRALSGQCLNGSTMRSLTWNDKAYVMDCRLREHQEQYQAEGKRPGVWRTLWRFDVDMRFSTADLPPTEEEA